MKRVKGQEREYKEEDSDGERQGGWDERLI